MPLGRKQTVEVANQLAQRFSQDAPMRALAGEILNGCQDVPREGPPRIASWIRENVMYLQESPAVEILQGPYTTLPAGLRVAGFEFSGTGVGDCDDLSILFATLCRAAGLEGYVAGISWENDREGFFHAMGYCNGNFYELSKDEPYGGIASKKVMASSLPVGQTAYIYEPAFEKKGYWIKDGKRSHVSAHGTVLKGAAMRGATMHGAVRRESTMRRMNPGQAAMMRQRMAMAASMRRRYASMGVDLGQWQSGIEQVVGGVTSLTGDEASALIQNWDFQPVHVALGKPGATITAICQGTLQGAPQIAPGIPGEADTKRCQYVQLQDSIDIAALIMYADGTVVLEVATSRKGEQAVISVQPRESVSAYYPLRARTGVLVRGSYMAKQGSGMYWKDWIGNEVNFARLSGLIQDAIRAAATVATTGEMDWALLAPAMQTIVAERQQPQQFTFATPIDDGNGGAAQPPPTERKKPNLLIPAAIAGALFFMLGG
jgi:hypothetical protein